MLFISPSWSQKPRIVATLFLGEIYRMARKCLVTFLERENYCGVCNTNSKSFFLAEYLACHS